MDPSKMYKPKHQELVDLRDTEAFGSDPKSWLSGDDQYSLGRTLSSISAAAATAPASGMVDRVLFNNLVEIVPLVQSLIDQKPKSSFTRRGSVTFTKAPSRDSLYKKSGRSALQTKKQWDEQSKNADNNSDSNADSMSIYSSEKDREELTALRNMVEDLKRQISEKDELLKSDELTKQELASICTEFEELKIEFGEKDSMIKLAQLQLSDAKIKLADKEAAMEKLLWEAMTSNKKVEKLQDDLVAAERDLSCFMLFVEGLTNNGTELSDDDYDFVPYPLEEDDNPDWTEMETQKLEAARQAYIAAVSTAKLKQDGESIASAASARLLLQSMIS